MHAQILGVAALAACACAAALPLVRDAPLRAENVPRSHAPTIPFRNPVRSLAKRSNDTGYAPSCTPTTSFLTQNVDSSGGTNATFQQQYQIITDYYQEGGPILFYQGDEQETMECVEDTILATYAQAVGGIAATLEHRYFGLSLPFGNDSYSQDNLKYLTLDNVISDATNFVNQIKANVSGAANASVVAASGSYGGFLVIQFRQNAPETFDAVIASAAPIRSLGADPNDADRYNWQNWVSDVFTNASQPAADKLHDGFAALQEAFTNNNISSLFPAFNLCPTAPNSSEYATTYVGAISSLLSLYAEFNYPFPSPGRTPLANGLETVINNILAVPDDQPLQALNVSIWTFLDALGGYDCYDPLEVESNAVYAIESFPFNYLNCAYFPLSSIDIDPNATFYGTTGSNFEATFPTTCSQTYGLTAVPAEQDLWAQYHYGPGDLTNSTGIIFVQGGFDPATSVGVADDFPVPADNTSTASRRLFVQNMAHREDLFAPNDADRPEVVALRHQELDTLKTWLGLY